MSVRAIRFAVLRLFALLVFASLATARAQAALELCPAVASVPLPVGAAFGAPARTFDYDVTALAPRTVSASLIADTTGGWYTWNVNGVTLASMTRSMRPSALPRQFYLQPYTIAASPTLAVTFPGSLTVRHVWVASANGVECDVPAFDAPSDRQPPNPDEVAASPSPLYAMASATQAQAPFASTGCDQPFAASTVLKAENPKPSGLREMSTGPLAVEVELALDPSGHSIDAWIYESSGYAGWDLSALRAARLSTYSGSISYCRPVRSTYLFLATIVPGRG